MFIAEATLLQAARDRIVSKLALQDEQCQVELDGMLPDYAPKLFIAVSPGGITPGQRHRSSGGTIDLYIAVKVTVYNRVTETARDRRRSTFIKLLTGLAPTLERVTRELEFNYELLEEARMLLLAEIEELEPDAPRQLKDNETGTFPEPFRSFTTDISSRIVMRDPYDAAQMAGAPADPIVAAARSVTFSGARYMQVRSQWQA
jgi:hypothetical protein